METENADVHSEIHANFAYCIMGKAYADESGVTIMPKISVIVPVYNMEKYVGECLDSILNQTLVDIEVIAINDGSTDASLKVLYEYQSIDNRIYVIDKMNEGVGAARNDGIQAAKGEFLAFIDPDDMYANDGVLAHLYEAAQKSCASIVGGRLSFLYENGSIEEETEKSIGTLTVRANGMTEYKDYQYDYGFSCFIYSRRLIVGNHIYFPLYSRFQDPPFFVKAMITAERFYALDEVVYLYRQLPGATKLTAIKTADFLHGIMDNLRVSKENNLAQLHYVSAERLNREGSYMVLHNLESSEIRRIIGCFIQASAMVDSKWLKEEGYFQSVTYVPEAFDYLVTTSQKYERMRRAPVLKNLLDVVSRLRIR
ncbi:MAG: glycosyltransferase family 2 protein [Candidatus Ventricola sp.]